MIEWISSNTETILVVWAAIVAVAEVAKRVIPGTKDDQLIVRLLDIGSKVLTLGLSSLAPRQDGAKKSQ